MGMEKIGLISTNLAEKIANSVTELPYRASAEMLSSSTGQTISAGGVWNIAQKLGQRITSEEELDVKKMKAGRPDGKREIGVLFEEMDGVWLSMQGRGHKRMGKKEMKVFTMYEGWDEERKRKGAVLWWRKWFLQAWTEAVDSTNKKRGSDTEKNITLMK